MQLIPCNRAERDLACLEYYQYFPKPDSKLKTIYAIISCYKFGEEM